MIPWVCRQAMRAMCAVFGHRQVTWALAVIAVQDDVKDRVVGASINVQLSRGEGGGDEDGEDSDLWREVNKIARDRWGMIDDATDNE